MLRAAFWLCALGGLLSWAALADALDHYWVLKNDERIVTALAPFSQDQTSRVIAPLVQDLPKGQVVLNLVHYGYQREMMLHQALSFVVAAEQRRLRWQLIQAAAALILFLSLLLNLRRQWGAPPVL